MTPRLPRVAFVTIDMPRDGETGGQIATWRVLKAYATFAELDVLALTPPDASVPPELTDLARTVAAVPVETFYYRHARLRLSAKLVWSQLGGRPYRIAKFDTAEARSVLSEWSAETRYDLLHCDHLATTPYVRCLPDAPFVVYDYDVDSHALDTVAATQANPLVRAVLRREAERTRAVERDVMRRAVRTFAVSEDDAQLLLDRDPDLDGKVEVCPVPLSGAQPVARRRGESDAFSVLVLGPLRAGGRLQGLRWFVSNVWPKFRSECMGARLVVVGAGAPPDVRDLDGRDGIDVRGFVEDLDAVLAEVDLCVMPLLAAGGIRIKVLELLPRGIPCLGSHLAVRGFAGVDGVYEANTPEEWLTVLGSIARSPEQFRESALAGATGLRARFSLEATAKVLQQAFADAATAAAGSS